MKRKRGRSGWIENRAEVCVEVPRSVGNRFFLSGTEFNFGDNISLVPLRYGSMGLTATAAGAATAGDRLLLMMQVNFTGITQTFKCQGFFYFP